MAIARLNIGLNARGKMLLDQLIERVESRKRRLREWKKHLLVRKRTTHNGKASCCGDCFRAYRREYMAEWRTYRGQ